ncbi:MAG TPA: peptidoglycan recognition family protein [Vicinamibacteria bacterium]|nr:peptidoglycan recognition family protein [Vicinamibacteria bacterium]
MARSPRLLGLQPNPIAHLEARGRAILDPVEKLRFLRRSLDRFEALDERLQAVPGAPLRWLAYRLTGVAEARPYFTGNPWGALDPPRRQRVPLPRRARRAVNAALLMVAVAGGIALAAAHPRSKPPAAAAPSSLPTPSPPAEPLPALSVGLAPARTWLVNSGPGFELYSNGLRIDTTYAVAGDPRRYRVFTVGKGMGAEVLDQPIGIVYHTSESDIWPLEESFNEKLRDSSQNLLRYLRKNRVYHYLIDRFGQVFRVVEEKDKANHAGMSVWSSGGDVYLNLNGPTIGVSFETRWEGGRALPITRAQFEAARRLTDYLRDKWKVPAEMCVTHGLASVNSKKHLIGHHLDWARGFPFEALGLPDQYRRPSPAVALFGFSYDELFLSVMGEPWPGVREAERQLADSAAAAGRTEDEERRERKATYDLWLEEQTQDAEAAEKAAAALTRRKASGG